MLQLQWVIKALKKVSKNDVGNWFGVCGITTSDTAKISCLKNGNGSATDDQSAIDSKIEDLNGIIDDDINA